MFSTQRQHYNEAGIDFSNPEWHGPLKALRYLSTSPPSPPPSPPIIGPMTNTDHYPGRPAIANNAKDHRDNLTMGNQDYQDKSWTESKNEQNMKLTQNQTRNHQKSPQKITAFNVGQYNQVKIRMLGKLNQQEKELIQKNEELAKMLGEVASLTNDIHEHTISLRKTKIKINYQSRYLCAMVEKGRLFRKQNLAMKNKIDGLPALKKVNEQQHEQIKVLTYNLKNWGELVLLVKKAETLNKALLRMVQTQGLSSPRNMDELSGFHPLSPRTPSSVASPIFHPLPPQTPSPMIRPWSPRTPRSVGSPFRYSKPLNPRARCFKSIKSPRRQFTDDEKGIINEKTGTPNQTRKMDARNNGFLAAEMKRKFAEACKENHVVSSTCFVKASLAVLETNNNSIAVNVVPTVFMSNSSLSSHQEPGDAKLMNVVEEDLKECDLSSYKQGKRDASGKDKMFSFDLHSTSSDETISLRSGFEDLESAVSPGK